MRSLFKRLWRWIDDRTGLSATIGPLARHKVPPGSRWAYVFGSATLFCFLLQVFTGVGLALLYQPTSSEAYQSLQYITYQAPLGALLRGLHYMGACGMIVMIGVHMIRVYLTAAYKFPREMNWVTGVLLFILTVVMAFTGQLLRWDSNGIWSTLVGAEQLARFPFIGPALAYFIFGGETINGQTLMRFFNYHVFITPALIFGIVGFHLYLVIRNGISEPAKAGRPVDKKTYRQWYQDLLDKKGVPFWPDAAWRDVVFSVLVILTLVALAIFVGAPELVGPADPTQVDVKPHPDWFLLWPDALYALMPYALESYVMFLMPTVLFGLLFAVPFLSLGGERAPIRRPWAIAGVVLTLAAIVSLTYMGLEAPWAPEFETKQVAAFASSAPEVALGYRVFYEKGCQYCHQMEGQGGSRGPDLSEVATRLTTEQMTIRIVNGGYNMPAFGGSLSRQELTALLDFLNTRRASANRESASTAL
ncbi:cytochrome b N-terminal domain-containing protein [Salmonirosea aquatica]|uniref:C-type cytochrome n=1 Tax=Salmonirosea aquatica TaxID=2654236 RepID=A0A7C9FQ54_9BACT|nr:c-type cytochrome [Cytophagaceae bacterium SJW1-29]